MPKNSLNVSLKGADDIFSTEESRQEQQREQVQQIPIGELFPFKNHPFKVLDDESMQRTVESVEQYGVLSPLIARPRPEGGYEIISGHRRQHAAQLAGLDALPVIVRQMDDDVEIWRAAWAACTNRALEAAGHPALVDHRSYKRRGIDKIPSVHLGPAASQMEKRGIRTDKGEVNRQIAADNKLLKEIKARITRLYRWSKAETEKPQTQQSSLTALWEAQQQLNAPHTRTGKIRALQESAALFSFLQANGIQSMQQLHEKIADMNSRYYDLRGKIVKAERRIAILTERGEMWEQYNQYKSIHKQLAKVKPEKREQFEQRHSRELILYDAAARYLKELKDSGEGITPKAWQREIDQLAAGKQTDTLAMKSMREDLKAVERLRKTAEQLSRQERDKSHDREPER